MTNRLETRHRQVLAITGMTCGSCARTVERVLARVPGVERASVDLASARAVVEGSASIADLISAVEAAEYGAKPVDEETNQGGSDERRGSGCCR